MKYEIPKIWENEPCYIIGGGWSLKGFDISILKNKNIIAINNAFKLADFIQICWFGDFQWYMWNENDITSRFLESSPPFNLISCHPRFEKHNRICYVQRTGGCGINKKCNTVYWNYCSGLT